MSIPVLSFGVARRHVSAGLSNQRRRKKGRFLFGMILIIAGGRHYNFTIQDEFALERLVASTMKGGDPVTEVVHGGARGADYHGCRWAERKGFPTRAFHPDWSLGRRAGPIRNAEMAKYADAVALFPGGRGTESMHREAVKAEIQIFDFR